MQPKGKQGSASDLLNLESHTWNITDGVTLTTETGNEHFVVLIDEGESTVTGDVRSNSLVVLFELHSDALTNGGVGLLGFDSNLLNNNASGLRRASEGLLPARDRVSLGVRFESPSSDMKNEWISQGTMLNDNAMRAI